MTILHTTPFITRATNFHLINQLSTIRKIPLILCWQVRELARVKIELIRMTVRIHMVWHDVHGGHLVLLLPLHAPVLEPDFDLALGEAERVGYLDPSPPCQISVEMEFFLQFQCLISSVWCPLTFCFTVRVYCTWKS